MKHGFPSVSSASSVVESLILQTDQDLLVGG